MSDDYIPKWKIRNWLEELQWLMNDKPFAGIKTTRWRINQMLKELETPAEQDNKDTKVE